MKSKHKGLLILGTCIFAGTCFAQITSTAELNAFKQEREAKVSQYTKNIDAIVKKSEKAAAETSEHFKKRLEQIKQQPDQSSTPKPEESNNTATIEGLDQNNISELIPNCDNCNDPKYNYHSNFLYDSKGNKIERLYPSRCKCVETAPAPVVTPSTDDSNNQPASHKSTNWGIKY